MAVVIDTNVWAVAAGITEQADEDCIETCIDTIAALRSTLVLAVDEAVLGRNGRHLVVKRGSDWVLGQTGETWLDLLMY